jgi:hypothetical protein
VSTKRNKTFHLKPGTGVEEYDSLPGPSLLKRTLGLQNRHHTEYVGFHATPDIYGPHGLQNLDASTAEEPMKKGVDFIRFVHKSHAFRIIPDSQIPGYEQEQRSIDEIQSTAQGHGAELVRLYFRIVHPSFPILHKDVFLEKYNRSYREFSPPLLAAVYLLASGYWSFSESLADSKRIDTVALQHLAFKSLQNTLRRPKISTLQAGLLLSQYQKAFAGNAAVEQQDRLTVQLVNLAHGLGIHLDCSAWDIPDWEISLRRRVGWGLYIQDKWTALLEGRPSLIRHEEWDVADLTEEDFPENLENDEEGSSEVGRGRLVFMHMAKLTETLADILRDLFSARARRKQGDTADPVANALEAIKSPQAALKQWFLALPDSLTWDTTAYLKLSSIGYLRMAYLSLEVCLYRHLMQILTAVEKPDLTLSRICREASRERFISASDFVHSLQPQQLCAFWYFGSAKCCTLIYSIGHILEHSAWQEEEKAFYTRKLKELKFRLKLSGEAGAFFMTQALALLNRPVRLTSESKDTDSSQRSPITSTTLVNQSGFEKDLSLMETWSPDPASLSNGTENNFSDMSADVDFLSTFPLNIDSVYAPQMVQGVYVNVYQQQHHHHQQPPPPLPPQPQVPIPSHPQQHQYPHPHPHSHPQQQAYHLHQQPHEQPQNFITDPSQASHHHVHQSSPYH